MAHVDRCPKCHSLDVRILTGEREGLDVVGYRCHDCGHTFVVRVTADQASTPSPARPQERARQK